VGAPAAAAPVLTQDQVDATIDALRVPSLKSVQRRARALRARL
jgi:hypothetical protein